MNLVGYCVKCHRVRYVRVNLSTPQLGGVPHGVCIQCEREGK